MTNDIIARALAFNVEEELKEAISSAYKIGGSLAFENLPVPSAQLAGYIYNVTNDFVTNSSFIEGAGHAYAAGVNVGIIQRDDNYYYDVFEAWTNPITNQEISELF